MCIAVSVTQNYLTQKSGEISSPIYPRTYRGSEDYFWTVNVNGGKRIQIFLKDFMCLSSFHHLKVSTLLMFIWGT